MAETTLPRNCEKSCPLQVNENYILGPLRQNGGDSKCLWYQTQMQKPVDDGQSKDTYYILRPPPPGIL